MNVDFTDFYGQHVNVNNRTASGNVRIEVRTMKNLNDLADRSPEACEVITDISLTQKHLRFLIETLAMMVEEE